MTTQEVMDRCAEMGNQHNCVSTWIRYYRNKMNVRLKEEIGYCCDQAEGANGIKSGDILCPTGAGTAQNI